MEQHDPSHEDPHHATVYVVEAPKVSFWRKLGGGSLTVSILIHAVVLIIGAFAVFRVINEPTPEVDFIPSGGGGGGGQRGAQYDVQKKKQTALMPTTSPKRVFAQGASSNFSLPPQDDSFGEMSQLSALSSGGMSGGLGGAGSGGGFGSGQGQGAGAGMGSGFGGSAGAATLFGLSGPNSPGLPGTLYDCKQTPDAQPTKYMATHEGYMDVMSEIIKPTWTAEKNLAKDYFKAPTTLYASQIFIPVQSSTAAPKAYGVADKMKESRWICEYKGTVTAPKDGKFRFWVYADDICIIRWDKKIVADNGWTILHLPGFGQGAGTSEEIFNGVDGTLKKSFKASTGSNIVLRPGPWIKVEQGQDYDMSLVMTDVGGLFGSYVFMEEADASKPGSKGDDKLFLFRMSDLPLPEAVKDDTGLGIDMTGKGLNWKARAQKAGRSF